MQFFNDNCNWETTFVTPQHLKKKKKKTNEEKDLFKTKIKHTHTHTHTHTHKRNGDQSQHPKYILSFIRSFTVYLETLILL